MNEPTKRNRSPGEVRDALLERAVLAVVASWLTNWSDELHREGRGMTGGWPGTLREARARITGQLSGELAREGMTALTFEELDRLAKMTYTKAKGEWLAHRERLSPEDETP